MLQNQYVFVVVRWNNNNMPPINETENNEQEVRGAKQTYPTKHSGE